MHNAQYNFSSNIQYILSSNGYTQPLQWQTLTVIQLLPQWQTFDVTQYTPHKQYNLPMVTQYPPNKQYNLPIVTQYPPNKKYNLPANGYTIFITYLQNKYNPN